MVSSAFQSLLILILRLSQTGPGVLGAGSQLIPALLWDLSDVLAPQEVLARAKGLSSSQRSLGSKTETRKLPHSSQQITEVHARDSC